MFWYISVCMQECTFLFFYILSQTILQLADQRQWLLRDFHSQLIRKNADRIMAKFIKLLFLAMLLPPPPPLHFHQSVLWSYSVIEFI